MTKERKSKDEGDRILVAGRADYFQCDNSVRTSKYTFVSFLPLAIAEQFRRFANVYFLCVGIVMTVGFYTDAWDTAVRPITIFGPLLLVISFSLLVEAMGDVKRHKNDQTANEAPCVVLHRISRNDVDMDIDTMEEEGNNNGKDHSRRKRKTSTRASAQRSRSSGSSKKRQDELDLSDHYHNQQHARHHNSMQSSMKSLMMDTSQAVAAAAAPARLFRRGIEIQRDKTMGQDVFVPLLPTILEDNEDGLLEKVLMTNHHNDALLSSLQLPPHSHSRICFQSIPRQDIRQGQLVLVKNREMVPADMVLLASSADHGSAYIETSSIDGETNLKLRNRATIPDPILRQVQQWQNLEQRQRQRQEELDSVDESDPSAHQEEEKDNDDNDNSQHNELEQAASLLKHETLEQAVKRVARCSALGNARGISIVEHPLYKEHLIQEALTKQQEKRAPRRNTGWSSSMASGLGRSMVRRSSSSKLFAWGDDDEDEDEDSVNNHHNGSGSFKQYVAALTSEPPNPHVHTFSGKLTLPTKSPFVKKGENVDKSLDPAADKPENEKPFADVPLGAENLLLRGAVLRNTEWAVGMVCFTGTDTKLVQNSFETPSKLSQLDRLMNWTVVAILVIMFIVITILASLFVVATNKNFDDLWYLGYHRTGTRGGFNDNVTTSNDPLPWPYLANLPAPSWETGHQNWIQMFFLFLTLLNNVIPMSLYVTVEFMTFAHQWFISVDQNMYDDTTNTTAIARSTNVTDLGRVQYIFSDKTGTLTQNVMRFKRCSVNGIILGAPITTSAPAAGGGRPSRDGKARVGRQSSPRASSLGDNNTTTTRARTNSAESVDELGNADDETEENIKHFPLSRLLLKADAPPLSSEFQEASTTESSGVATQRIMSFNAEMFLRVMSLCHTVVVEKDLDLPSSEGDDSSAGEGGYPDNVLTPEVEKEASNCPDENSNGDHQSGGGGIEVSSGGECIEEGAAIPNQPNEASDFTITPAMGPDGAPLGYAYQAESPDEGALVSAASSIFGYQVVKRDSSGIQLLCHANTGASILSNPSVVQALKDGTLGISALASQTAASLAPGTEEMGEMGEMGTSAHRLETWSIMAVNKFDSDRKRMSIVVRSPPELGSLPIVFCKGADVSMIDPDVSIGVHGDAELDTVSCRPSEEEQEWEIEQFLELETHLGDFASEGLRTLVLGMKVLSEAECKEWLETYQKASTSINDRDEMLKAAALGLERDLFIVGATAIEDKLQKDVPKTIAQLSKAGIKMWVLTGDKRETAVEIGYSTHVLTPKMHVTEVPDDGAGKVRTKMAMEFIRLVKFGKLHNYQRSMINANEKRFSWENFFFRTRKSKRRLGRFVRKHLIVFLKIIRYFDSEYAQDLLIQIAREGKGEAKMVRPAVMRRNVRYRADSIVANYLESNANRSGRKLHGQSYRNHSTRLDHNNPPSAQFSMRSLHSIEDVPLVFNRAKMSKSVLKDVKSQRMLGNSHDSIVIGRQGVDQIQHLEDDYEEGPLVDEDCLSMDSRAPATENEAASDFDKGKVTMLERCFAVDHNVRNGQLGKHLKDSSSRLVHFSQGRDVPDGVEDLLDSEKDGHDVINAPRALVIEGAALKHMFGDAELEQMLFAVASQCDAVIACRVSPKQKALLVNLVRQNVVPEPVTLAIGDGANDVGMIQEAHVGVGISGKEGQQAVNAADFAIAQFRFLEELVLIHGRWNFFRMSTMVLFQFYKNCCMVGCLVLYTGESMYSGVSLFDQWAIPLLNFVSGIPIFFLGVFDRCLSKDYVRRHPEVFQPARENELVTFRILLRWVALVLAHCCILFFGTVYELSSGGGVTSAFRGLMGGRLNIGDGEGGDLKSVGTVTFSCLIFVLAYKVLFESRSLIHGRWPAFTCRKDGEGFMHRLPYTWIGVTFLSIGMYLGVIVIYNLAGQVIVGFNDFANIAFQVMGTRSLVWLLILFVPIISITLDVCFKVFSNMYYPTQTQIHVEIEYLERDQQSKERRSQRERAS